MINLLLGAALGWIFSQLSSLVDKFSEWQRTLNQTLFYLLALYNWFSISDIEEKTKKIVTSILVPFEGKISEMPEIAEFMNDVIKDGRSRAITSLASSFYKNINKIKTSYDDVIANLSKTHPDIAFRLSTVIDIDNLEICSSFLNTKNDDSPENEIQRDYYLNLFVRVVDHAKIFTKENIIKLAGRSFLPAKKKYRRLCEEIENHNEAVAENAINTLCVQVAESIKTQLDKL